MNLQRSFSGFSTRVARGTGHPIATAVSVGVVVAWAASGPFLGYSNTWQLIINTITNIATLIMVFIIQNTQNGFNNALQIKLDELIRATPAAHGAIMDLETLTEPELDRIKREYAELARQARAKMREGKPETGIPDLPDRNPL